MVHVNMDMHVHDTCRWSAQRRTGCDIESACLKDAKMSTIKKTRNRRTCGETVQREEANTEGALGGMVRSVLPQISAVAT